MRRMRCDRQPSSELPVLRPRILPDENVQHSLSSLITTIDFSNRPNMAAVGDRSGADRRWTGRGVVQVLATLRDGSQLSQSTFERWLHEVYLPEVLNSGVTNAITSWKAASPNYERPWMILMEVRDLELLHQRHTAGGAFHSIPRTSDQFPTDGPVDEFVDFESRILSEIQVFGSNKTGLGKAANHVRNAPGTCAVEQLSCLTIADHVSDGVDTMIYAAMQPASGGEEDLDAWYREEHNEQMSREPGYVKTTRYRPLLQTRTPGSPTGLDFVAFHQFGEKNKVGLEVQPLQPMTDWTKKCISECTSIDAAVFNKMKTIAL